jgi:glycosyltransferase involved in cell wall biosynthesis/peptidoglycan/xylan/chitin deacetylase (PgdA/CDA1 family)
VTRFSIIVPTHERREVVLRGVGALERQVERNFEVVVVVDGATDGTAEALRKLRVSFPLKVIEQENSGAAQARNAGAAAARGEILVTLDDDMEADPRMLAEHERSHREGADVVLGDIPLNPASPRTLLSDGVGEWAATRRERLAAPGAEIGVGDLLTGQLSIGRGAYEDVGGFDASFTREGLFGGEDIDFGYRLEKAGYSIVFNPAAISYQYYDIDPASYLKRTEEAGRSDWELVVKHPELALRMGASPRFKSRRSRWLLAPLVAAPRALSAPIRTAAVALARSGTTGRWAKRLFFAIRTMEYLRGVRLARGRRSSGEALVLAYHSLSDLSDDPKLSEYGIPGPRFEAQMEALAARGRRFVDLDRVLDALAGRASLPAGATLVTFDDAYADVLPAVEGVLKRCRIPAVVFAVSGQIGGTNEWDHRVRGKPLPLLGANELRSLPALGVEVGSHTVSHRGLSGLSPREVTEELRESAFQLEAAGLPRPRAFAYPYGDWTAECAAAVAESGYAAAFTIDPGLVRGGCSPFTLPRVEVLASDSPLSLRIKIATCSWPAPLRRRLLRLFGSRI